MRQTPVRRRRWIGVSIAVLVALVALTVTLGKHDTAASRTPNAVKPLAVTGALSAAPASMGSANAPVKLSVTRRTQPLAGLAAPLPTLLPPLDTKVVDVLAQLQAAADRGDMRAACRVGAELARCFRARLWIVNIDRVEQQALRSGDPSELELARRNGAVLRARSAPDLTRCEGVDDATANEAWSYLVQAASGGNAAAAGMFYAGPPVDRSIDTSEILDAWAEHREEYRDAAIKAGDLYALSTAAIESLRGVGWGGPLHPVPIDRVAALKYLTALIPLANAADTTQLSRTVDEIAATVSPEQVAEAKREGDAMRDAYFRNVPSVSDVVDTAAPRPERCAESAH